MSRIAIVDKEKCNPNKCKKECIKACPPMRSGKQVIDIEDLAITEQINDKKQIIKIVESLCIGCNQCVRVCPFNAIKIINLPIENKNDIIHRYSINGFRLYKLPILKQNIVIGIIGENGIGKTTIIDILTKKIIPNFENFNKSLTKKEIINKFKGNVLQNYLQKLYNDQLTFSVKEQYLQTFDLTVNDFLLFNSIDLTNLPLSFYELEIDKIINNNILTLSGGELQKLLCWITSMKNADVYIFDEPSNFLDVKQRLIISRLIKSLSENKYVVVIEHDLSILDYICDELYIIYGKPTAFGIVSKPLTVFEGINMYLEGFISTQNIRFRDYEFNLRPSYELRNENIIENNISFDSHIIEYPNYKLTIQNSNINLNNTINIILGENGTGKSTFINWLGKSLDVVVSIKEQFTNIEELKINNLYPTVLELFYHKIGNYYFDHSYQHNVISQLDIEILQNKTIDELSGGELQRVMIALCLGHQSDIYLLDEPSANLDIEKRLKIIKILKKFVVNNNKTLFIIEHDIMMCVAFGQELNSKIFLVKQDNYVNNIKECSVSQPLDFVSGINSFLQLLNITMRISNHNRPRINKYGSQLDQEQKKNGNYYGI